MKIRLLACSFYLMISLAAAGQYPDATTNFLYNEANYPPEQHAFCQIFRDVIQETIKFNSMSDLQKAQSTLKAPDRDEAWRRVHRLLGTSMSFTKWHGMLRPGRVEKDGVRLEFEVSCYQNGPGSRTTVVLFGSGPPNSPDPYSEAGPKSFNDPVVQAFTKMGHGGAAEVSGKLYPSVNQPNEWFAQWVTLRNAPDGPYLTAFTKVALLSPPH
jgi:hypothetical protein